MFDLNFPNTKDTKMIMTMKNVCMVSFVVLLHVLTMDGVVSADDAKLVRKREIMNVDDTHTTMTAAGGILDEMTSDIVINHDENEVTTLLEAIEGGNRNDEVVEEKIYIQHGSTPASTP